MKKLGYPNIGRPISTNFGNQGKTMFVNKKAVIPGQIEESFENLQLNFDF
jgi:hypothetical protein